MRKRSDWAIHGCAALRLIRPEIAGNLDIFPDARRFGRLEMIRDFDARERRSLSRMWTEIKVRWACRLLRRCPSAAGIAGRTAVLEYSNQDFSPRSRSMSARRGTRVLDLSRVLAGPSCGQWFADFGAGAFEGAVLRRASAGSPSHAGSNAGAAEDAPRRGLRRFRIAGAALLAASLMHGCAAPGPTKFGRFVPLGTENGVRMFQYSARADVVYPLDTPEGEAARRRWLEDTMLVNNFCRDDFTIIGRVVVDAVSGWPGPYEVRYTGRCKP